MKAWLIIVFLITLVTVITLYMLPHAKAEHIMTFPKWKESYDLTRGVIESDAHNAYVEILMNKKAVAAYREVKSFFPVGSKLYKPLYSDFEGKKFARLVIMVKMEEGYDPDNGDWWYGVYDESGTKMTYQGRIPECISCHAMAKETDYLFSRSVMKKLGGIDTNEFEEYLED